MNPLSSWLVWLARQADSPWFFPVVLAATVSGLFFDCIGPDKIFAHRDAIHFYPQLYRMVRDEWLAGRVPLWNPLLNCGQPLAGCGTSGGFYVPQLAITLLLPDGMSLNVYGILHLAFAATGGYLLARHQGCPRPAATVAGLAYAFAGSVLLQIYNPIYAAGAAWLVWAVYAGIRLLDGGGGRNMLVLAAALAMSVFAGEPQAAYHAGLVLGVWWLMQPARSWRGLGMLAAAGLAGGLLCLVQVMLAAEFAGETTRAMDRAPYSLWQVPRFLSRSLAEREGAHWYDILIGRPPADAVHYESLYNFSLRPIRLLELLWPDVSGRSCYRWLSLLRLDDSGAWANSIYAGIITVIAATLATAVCRRSPRVRSWLVLLGLAALASIGGLGAVGFARNVFAVAQGRFAEIGYRPGDEVGGLYWLLSIGLPGYAGFRYPEKWMTVFSLALAQLAGLGLAHLRRPAVARRCLRIAAALAVVLASGVAALLLTTIALGPGDVLPGAAGDSRRAYALEAMTAGGLQAAVCAATAAGLAAARAAAGRRERAGYVAAVALLTAADLVVAGRREIVVGSYRGLAESSDYVVDLAASRRPELAAVSPGLRVAIQSQVPQRVDERDPDLLIHSIGAMLRSHVPWMHGCGIFGQSSTAMQIDTDILLRPLPTGSARVPPRRAIDLAGVEYFLLSLEGMRRERVAKTFADWSAEQRAGTLAGPAPAGPPLPSAEIVIPGVAGGRPAMLAIRNEAAAPRAQIVRRVVPVAPVAPGDCRARERLLTQIAYPCAEVPDLFQAAVVEMPAGASLPEGTTPSEGNRADRDTAAAQPPVPEDSCRIVHDDPQRVVVEARLDRPGLLMLADTFSRDWSARVSTVGAAARSVPILRANHVHRGVPLPAGESVVEFRYHSWTFAWSGAVTLAAWGVWGLAAVWLRVVSGTKPVR